MLVLDDSGPRPLSRRYTIRRLDRVRREVELDIVAHGVAGPGARWAAEARPGDRINGVGPRGKIFIDPDAVWHLFVGDETAAPGALAMLESLPSDVPGQAVLEVEGPSSELPHVAGQRVTWLHRGDTPAVASTGLTEAVATVGHPRRPRPGLRRRRGPGGHRDPPRAARPRCRPRAHRGEGVLGPRPRERHPRRAGPEARIVPRSASSPPLGVRGRARACFRFLQQRPRRRGSPASSQARPCPSTRAWD